MNYNFYDDMSVINGYKMFNNTNKLDLFNPYEGYLKGNAFKDEYIPYKNYSVEKPVISSEKEEMLINIGQYSFMMHDMNLYLDVYPNDKDALYKFNEYQNKTKELIMKYERKYGPLTIKSNDDKESFNWVVSWPWVE